ncbi:putative transcriptional regulator [Thermoactinomyces sp. DSM 45891]|uniref:helix-turn-helix domain-containing protein n=1 Tax=Thermoactinomyces sp. DSM 45891 TaxID=1761907 RepID=UPI000916BBF1|nr:helix-turn-helix transcriptional regulator [Thermoactinomyces sp. DSM 45891]SFX82396.1 putative transcriptional regulator [Thermoactinomyces sp. DSM 45891]
MDNIEDFLKFHRKKVGLTQNQVAKLVGVSRAFYSNIEGGRRRTPYEKIYQLAETLEVDVDTLLYFYAFKWRNWKGEEAL